MVTYNASELARVTFAGGVELCGTLHHPVWSLDREMWVGLSELEPGERVSCECVSGENGSGLTGEHSGDVTGERSGYNSGIAVVEEVQLYTTSEPVYNLETHGEHVYQVTSSGVLVHNAGNGPGCSGGAKGDGGKSPTGNAEPAGEGAPSRLHSPADLERISRIRSDLGVGKGRNIAFGEGHINGKDFGEVLGVSGRNTPGVQMPSQWIFRTSVDEFDRAFDGEVFVLENLARRLKPTDSGTIRLVSLRAFCDSCSDVIAQFRQRFPNIRLILVDGTP